MSTKNETAVPWGFLGSFLTDAQLRIDTALKDMPESRLSYLEIKLYRKAEDDSPVDEYNLSTGEEGKQLCSVIEEEEAPQELSLPLEAEETSFLPPSLSEIETSETKQVDVSQDVYKPTPAYELVRELVYGIRDELAKCPEVDGFAAGIRAIVSTNPDECTGFCCARRLVSLLPVRYEWYLQEYYVNLLGQCRKKWTRNRC